MIDGQPTSFYELLSSIFETDVSSDPLSYAKTTDEYSKTISEMNPDDVFCKPKNVVEAFNNLKIRPVIRSYDLNNSEDEPDVNKPKKAIVIGLNFRF